MQRPNTMGMRRFGAVNWIGFQALYAREVRRFVSIHTQTVLAPALTSGLFMLVFVLAFGERRGDVAGVGFAAFLAPGLLMMSVIQNAFANSSSSIIVAKIQGNIIDTLMPPLSPGEMLAGYARFRLRGRDGRADLSLCWRWACASALGYRVCAVRLAYAGAGRRSGWDLC